jgi:hypothetical protein
MEDFDLTYTRIASSVATPTNSRGTGHANSSQQGVVGGDKDVDQKVDDAIDTFLQSLTPIGPDLLQGIIHLQFVERRASKQLFGWVSQEERVVWETWVLRVLVNTSTVPTATATTAADIMERQRRQDTAERMLQACLQTIFDCASESIEHIPPIMYEFDIQVLKQGSNLNTREHNIRTRVTHMPKLIQLG